MLCFSALLSDAAQLKRSNDVGRTLALRRVDRLAGYAITSGRCSRLGST